MFVFMTVSFDYPLPNITHPSFPNMTWKKVRIMISLGVTQYSKMHLFNFQTLVTATSFTSTVWDLEKMPVILL